MRFHQQSSVYEQHARVQRALVAWGVSELGDYTGRNILEMGAGTGMLTRELVRRGADVVATDLAQGMLAQGKQTCPSADWRELNAWSGEKIAGAPFDGIATSALLQWAPDAGDVFKKWIHYVKPQGELFALLFAEPSLPELRDVCPEAMPFEWRTCEAWLDACAQGGWDIQSNAEQKVSFVYPSAHAFLRSLHGIGAIRPNRLGVTRVRRLLKDYDASYGSDGAVRASWSFLKIRAKACS